MKAEPLFRFIHCADLHLDSPFRGIQALDPAISKLLQEATFKSFSNIVNLALSSHADFIIISGDIYNEADRSLHAQLKFREMLQKATDSGIQCYICHGNHDHLSGWEADIKFPEKVHRFGHGDVERVPFMRGKERLADIYGISYPEREVNQNLSKIFKKASDSVFSIGMLHCNVGGDKAHENYAPCTKDDLVEVGMDYWALGHIHASRVIREEKPCIVFPGCIQGLDILEGGTHGCYLVNVKADKDIDIKFHETDEVRWSSKDVDISDLNTMEQLLDTLSQTCQDAGKSAGRRTALLRISLVGRGPLHYDLQNRIDPEKDIAAPLREGANIGQGEVWVESVQVNTRPEIDIASRRKADDSVGDFLRESEKLKSQKMSDDVIKDLLREKAPRFIAGQIDLLTASDISEIRDGAEWLGLDKLEPEE